MDVRLELYNTYYNTKDYLSAELTHLPSLYLLFSLLYLCLLGFWISVCSKNQHDFHTIHFLMGVLLVATFGYFICAAADQHDLKVTGTRHGWDVWFYTFQLIRFVILFTMIALIGMGCSLWKPFLQGKDKLVLMIVILFQVFANVASMRAGQTGPYSEKQVECIFVDFLCCIAIFFPFGWSASLLKKTCQTDENSARNLETLGTFMIMVSVYVFFTMFIVHAIAAFVVDNKPLVVHVADETCSLVFYMVMLDMFGPCLRMKRQLGWVPWYIRFFRWSQQIVLEHP